jgi:hypothetical protein
MQVEYRPPPFGTTQVPIKITGAGTLELSESGLRVVGAAVASRGRALVFLLGMLVLGVLMVTLQSLGVSQVRAQIIGAAAGMAFLFPLLRKPATAGAPVELQVPWGNVKKIVYDGLAQCMVIVIKGMKPSGGLFVVQPPDSPLQRELAARIAARP